MRRKPEPRKIVEQLRLLLAFVVIILLTLLIFLIFHPVKEALKLSLPSLIAGIVTILLIYIFRNILFGSLEDYLNQSQIDEIARQIAERLLQQFPPPRDVQIYERWERVPWDELLQEANHVEVVVSYLDNWVSQVHDSLENLFARGGTAVFFLPKPGSVAADRVTERFPGSSMALVNERIQQTATRLYDIFERSAVESATLRVYWTETFIMHLMMHTSSDEAAEDRLLFSLFDHFRRGAIEAPTAIIDLAAHPRLRTWAQKELSGFQQGAELWTPLGPLSTPRTPVTETNEQTPVTETSRRPRKRQ